MTTVLLFVLIAMVAWLMIDLGYRWRKLGKAMVGLIQMVEGLRQQVNELSARDDQQR